MKQIALFFLLMAGTLQAQTESFAHVQADFCVRTLKALQAHAPNQNQFYSPYGLHHVLTMALLGATPQSSNYTEIANVLGWRTTPAAKIGEAYATYLPKFRETQQGQMQVGNASSVWVHLPFSVNPVYKEQLRKYFKTEIYPFMSQTAQLRETSRRWINAWIARTTNNVFKKYDFIPDAPATLYLINAMYLNAQWKSEFERANTSPEPFYNSDKTQQDVRMMHAQMFVGYAEIDNCQVVRLAYRGDAAMYIFLPKPSMTLQTWIQRLNSKKLLTAIKKTQKESSILRVSLPNFSMQHDIQFSEILASMGMKTQAGFSNISNMLLSIRHIRQRLALEVYEEGTVASSITYMPVDSLGSDRPDIKDFKVNRPFFFTINHDSENVIWFSGKVEHLKK